MSEIFISVDVETAGPIPGVFSMLSLGACVVGDSERTFYAELRPTNNNFIPEAMKVVGHTLDDFCRNGRDPKEVMTAFADWVHSVAANSRPVFVGFNATFDWAFVNFYFHTYFGDNPFGFGGIDIKSYYMGMSGCAWDETRSSRIPAIFKPQGSHTHNALEDAREQGRMFETMLNRTK